MNVECELLLTVVTRACERQGGKQQQRQPRENSSMRENHGLKLFNRWGNSLFATTDQNFVWNGEEKKDKLVDPGTYFYLVSYFLNGEKKEISGFVNIYY